ncbi:MAG: hypothetical protein M3306_13220 [Actinomycetota bacterium]|nr:hypothetical protein [Actinomycetota bacterium]
MSLRDAVLARKTGLGGMTAVKVALGLARLGPLHRAAQDGDRIEEFRSAIGTARSLLDDVDPTSPVAGWVHDHLDQLLTEISLTSINGRQVAEMAPEEPLFEVTAMMTAPYPLSVGELLEDASSTARQLLYDPEASHAPGMVSSWVRAIEATSRLLAALPETAVVPPLGHRRFADSLARRVIGFQQSVSGAGWTSADASDVGLELVVRNLRDATSILRTGDHQRPVLLEQVDDVHAARHSALQTLYVATHAVGVTLEAFRSESAAPRGPGHGPGRPAYGWKTRVESFEQFLHAELAGTARPGLMRLGSNETANRLEVALASWEAQAGRVLATRPAPRTVGLIAHVQSLIAETAGTVLAGTVDPDLVDPQRIEQSARASQEAWHRLGHRWFDLAKHTDRPDDAIVVVGREVRTALNNLIPAASNSEDFAESAGVLAAAVSSGVETAARIQYASEDPRLRGPARQVMRLNEQEADRLDLRFNAHIAPSAIRHNSVVRLPLLVSRALARSSYENLVAAESFATASHVRVPSPRAIGPVLQQAVLLPGVRPTAEVTEEPRQPERGARSVAR